MNISKKKIGVLGGGQLGRMLQEKALEYGINLYFMDEDAECPCSIFKDFFTLGSFRNYEDILRFGKNLDVLTVEIEHINVDALEVLEKNGTLIIPNVASLRMIQNKAYQKQFYSDHNIPTSPFIIQNDNDLDVPSDWFPFVQKSQRDGYDGKGVQVIMTEQDMSKQLHCPSIIEKMVAIEKELAITVSIDKNGVVRKFPICEMVFDPELNLVDYLIAPSIISKEHEESIHQITDNIVQALNSSGVFSIEFFLTKNSEILVNEMAPRTHNSAHYTIEATHVSQFEAQLRILIGTTVPEIKMSSHAAMINLVGAQGYKGVPFIEGFEDIMTMNNLFFHLYGKKLTNSGRKMGHITLLNSDRDQLIEDVQNVKKTIKIKADDN